MTVYHDVDPDEFIDLVKQNKCYAFDIEHPPELHIHTDPFRLAGVSFATGPDDESTVAFYETRKEQYTYLIRNLFAIKDAEAIAFNGKYDLQGLVRDGVIDPVDYPELYCDPMIATNLLDDNRRPGELGLKTIMRDGFGVEMMDFKTAWSHGEDSVEFAEYATDDAVQEFFLWKFLKPRLTADGLDSLFWKILMPSSKLFSDMQLEGVGWNIDGARKLLRGFQELRERMQKEIFEEIGPLNLNSGDQLARRLFDELGYDTTGVPMTDSGKRLKTDSAVMDMLAKKYPVCDKIRTYRTAAKMNSTYVEPITRMALADPKGRVHPTFWLVSATGRTRCDKPNFQNIPAWIHTRPGFEKLNIRYNIEAAPGRKLIVADLSQIELRLCGHISQDPLFLKAYNDWNCSSCGASGSTNVIQHVCPNCGIVENEDAMKGKCKGFWHGLDLHSMTANNIPALGGNRQNGKTANFALIYLATARRMNGEYPELSIKQWGDVIDGFFDTYKGVRKWHILMEQMMKVKGVCTDIFGRKRRISQTDIRRAYKHALNQFVNFPVQASACNLIQLSMVKLRDKWIADGVWRKEIFPSNFVHDEIIFEAVEGTEQKYADEMQHVMENTVQLRCPVRTDPLIVDRWGMAK